ncbi:ribosome silencing factor [Candidatus Marinimicrobia bacterium]|nr:ribosome silencing factor [Candidatus Neomarinimicrobiota bacterium]MDC1038003.1 ribosome silencing factor [Candidatus Neomarinimicrobiota bacterium]
MTESTQDFVTDFPLLKQIVNLAQEKKAVQLVAMDVRGLSSITDYFVICSGDSEPQVKAIADNIRKGTPKKPNHLEGYENLNWVLMDYFDVVVHVFGKNDRDYYNIEKLWADAPITEFTDEAPETTDF